MSSVLFNIVCVIEVMHRIYVHVVRTTYRENI